MIRDKIIYSLERITGVKNPILESPENESFGDYSTNIAMQIGSKGGTPATFPIQMGKGFESVRERAERISELFQKDKELMKVIEKVEIAGPGFINFWLRSSDLVGEVGVILDEKDNYGRTKGFEGKKILLEHTSPNSIKTLHVGHVRNNVLGMTVHNLLEYCGAKVTLDAINNDRGIHVMKAVWAYMKYGKGSEPCGEKPDHFVDKFYVMGAKEAEDNPQAGAEMQELLRRWEAGDTEVRAVWKKLRDWTLEGFQDTYKRLGSLHDHQWFESDFYEHGKEIVVEGLKKGVFRKLDDGAVLTNLEKYKLPDTIVLRADGTSMYLTQDLYLTKLKKEKFPSNLYIWDIGPEQDLYLRQLFMVCEQLGIGKVSDYYHLSYGFVYLKGGGKMSSRAGNVISADELIDRVVNKAKEIINKSGTDRGLDKNEKSAVAEQVGLAALKYGFLKIARNTDIYFDIDESLNMEGNSGPYIQYTYARTQSVLAKSGRVEEWKSISKNIKEVNNEELLLLRSFIHFSEVIEKAAQNYAPNLLCNYLYGLAQKYNTFYNLHGILEQRTKNKQQSDFRLILTVATGQILKNGLAILGIETPEKM